MCILSPRVTASLLIFYVSLPAHLCPQWLAIMWLVCEEQESSRPELGILRDAQSVEKGKWHSRASEWITQPGAPPKSGDPDNSSGGENVGEGTTAVGASPVDNSPHEPAPSGGDAAGGVPDASSPPKPAEAPARAPTPSLNVLVSRVLEAGLVQLTEAIDRDGTVRHGAKPESTDSYDLNAVPFGFSSALSYIFPASLVLLWMEVERKAINRDNGKGEWSDREVVRHYLYLRAACTSFGGGIQFAIKGMLDRPATTRSRLNRLLIDVARCLSLETRNSIWIMVLVKAIEAVHDNARYWVGDTSEKGMQLEAIVKYVTHGNAQVNYHA